MQIKSTNAIVCFLLVILSRLSTSLAQDWPEFRGPGGNGLATVHSLPAQWTADNIRWQTLLPGRGWSSPVIAGNEIWLTTAIEQDASPEKSSARLRFAQSPGLEARESVRLLAICVDRETGQIAQQIELFAINDPPLTHGLNSYASPTPVIDAEHVYCHFGTMGTAAINRSDYQVAWRSSELKFDHETGPGSSPILEGDLLIVNCDGIDRQFIAAFRKSSGELAWQRDRSGELHPQGMMKKAFSTPTVAAIGAEQQLISQGANWIYGYDPVSGEELWKISYGKLGFSNVPRPLVANNMIYFCTGFTRSSLVAIRVGGKSRLSTSDVVWQYHRQVPTMPTPILVGELIFMVSDGGIATCLDAASGEEIWQQRLGGDFSASPIHADNKLFFCNREGDVFVVAPEKEFKLLATNKMDSPIMATPAAVENHLIVRTKQSLYRIED